MIINKILFYVDTKNDTPNDLTDDLNVPNKISSEEEKEESDDGFDDFKDPENENNEVQADINLIKEENKVNLNAKVNEEMIDNNNFDNDLQLPNDQDGYYQPQDNSSDCDSKNQSNKDDSFDDFWDPEQTSSQTENISQIHKEIEEEKIDNHNEIEKDCQTNQIIISESKQVEKIEDDDNEKINWHVQKQIESESDDGEIKADDSSDEQPPKLFTEMNANDTNSENQQTEEIKLDENDDSFDDFTDPKIIEDSSNQEKSSNNDPCSKNNEEIAKLEEDHKLNDKIINSNDNTNNKSFEDFEEPKSNNIGNEANNAEISNNNDYIIKTNEESFDDFAEPEEIQNSNQPNDTLDLNKLKDKNDSLEDIERPVISDTIRENKIECSEDNQNNTSNFEDAKEVIEENVWNQEIKPTDLNVESRTKVEIKEMHAEDSTISKIDEDKDKSNDDESFEDFTEPECIINNSIKEELKDNKAMHIEENNKDNKQELIDQESKGIINNNSENSNDGEIKPDEDSFDEFTEPITSQKLEQIEDVKSKDDSFDDFADPDENKEVNDKEDIPKILDNNINKTDDSNNSQSDKIEMKNDDSFDDFADPDTNNQITGSSEQQASDQLRIPENYQETSSRSEGIDLKEDSDFDDFAEPEEDKKEENKLTVESINKEDSDFDEFNEPTEIVKNNYDPEDKINQKLEVKNLEESKTSNKSDTSIPQKQIKSLFDNSIEEFFNSESYSSHKSSSKSSIFSISKSLLKTPISLNLKEISSKFKSQINQEILSNSNWSIPSYTVTYSLNDNKLSKKAPIQAQLISRPSILKSKRSCTFDINVTYKPQEVIGKKQNKLSSDQMTEQILDLDFGVAEKRSKRLWKRHIKCIH